ncbi:MAG TPA: PhnD/SsuA/transferrin family substrate-binding protein [Rhodocyclaceae bacterium]|nr:PhnD/SsuA/transferrin family substrate-binding protein [Rhodocyclaceae bacterium]HRQ45444.1 PhnD/SsuA/transferrin family substrate-binding protein [Rhodocyclaceae bacterium]
MERRVFLKGLGAAALGVAAPALGSVNVLGNVLRIGLTPVFLDDQAAFLNRWRDYLAFKTGLQVSFVQRSSYREISEQVNAKSLDMAWMCGYPYVMDRDRLKLMAVPLHLGKPEYRSYLIARHDEGEIHGMNDLAGRVFAFSDPNSFSGSLYPRFLLHREGRNYEQFFRRSFYTWSHRKVVEAVAVGLADGGAVAGYVWETLARIRPEITARTRVVSTSPVYGFPPFVARKDVDSAVFTIVQNVFLDMRGDPEGERLLETLNLDGFVAGTPDMFDEIREMARLVDQR